MMEFAIIGLISIPVTLGLPFATALITSTPPPGPIMAKSPRGRSTLATDGAADIRLFFQLNPDVSGRPVYIGVAEAFCSQRAGSTFMIAVVASASITTYRPPSCVLTSMREMAFQREYSIHLGSRNTPLA